MTYKSTEVSNANDVVALEHPHIEQQIPFTNTYQAIQWAAQQYSHHEALRYFADINDDVEDQVYNYQSFLAHVNQAANLFNSLSEHEPVTSYLLPNLPQTHFTIWGGEAAGIVNALNLFLEVDKIAALMNSAKSNLLVCLGPDIDKASWEKTRAISKKVISLQHILVISRQADTSSLSADTGLNVINFDNALATQCKDCITRPREITPQTIASYFHTGGTTGTPKIAKHSHFNEVSTAWSSAIFMHGQPGDTCLVGLPLFHVNAVIGTGLGTLVRGGTILLAGTAGFRTQGVLENLWQLIEKYRVNTFSCVPTILASLLNIPVADADISSLDFAICGAAPLSAKLMQHFETTTGAKVLEGYGLTEGGCVSTLNPPGGQRKCGSIGIRLPHQQLRIAHIEGNRVQRDCQTNEIGLLLIKGPNVFPGYLDETKNLGVLLEGGWLNTGDLARIDDEAYVWLTGREKDLIIRGGHNIDPGTIEDVLISHPSVSIAAAIGQPDAYAGELPCAYVSLKPDQAISTRELMEFAKKHISERAASPVNIEILATLPLTAVGKVFKPELRKMAIKRVLHHQFTESRIKADIRVELSDKTGIEVFINSQVKKTEIDKIMTFYAFNYTVN